MHAPNYAWSPLHVTSEPIRVTPRERNVFPFSAPEVDEDDNPITLIAPGATVTVLDLTTGEELTGRASLESYAGRTAWVRVEALERGESVEVAVLLHRSDQGREQEMKLAVECGL